MGAKGKRTAISAAVIGALLLPVAGIQSIASDPLQPSATMDLTVGYSANVFVDVDNEGEQVGGP